ncbi:hypothetical protein Drorol1_Dr00002751 [Drosera rotundifolia]
MLLKSNPAFPYVAPFPSTVPNYCRFAKPFVEDSVSFMSNGGQFDFYDVVKKCLGRLALVPEGGQVTEVASRCTCSLTAELCFEFLVLGLLHR